MKKIFLPLFVFLIGCGANPGKKDDPVDVAVSVTKAGKPVSGVVLNLHVITTGSPAAIPLRGGETRVKAVPGVYTWYISEGRSLSDFRVIPPKYREGATDRTVEVKAGSSLDLKID